MNSQNIPLKTCCGGDIPAQQVSTVHNGKKLYFCDTACLNLFQKNPDRFLSSTHFRLKFEDLDDAE
ncbi:MAG: hypothetical protein HeimAB125_09860 [Candidatus Heimdallarchaeota archaeon AB_125]|nr:MAG: hypothetical protein HeimAB125_09860 [Candidatus Heimdallarchaeota archaeon AB_125]